MTRAKRKTKAQREREARAAVRRLKRVDPARFAEWHEMIVAKAAMTGAINRYKVTLERWKRLGEEPGKTRANR